MTIFSKWISNLSTKKVKFPTVLFMVAVFSGCTTNSNIMRSVPNYDLTKPLVDLKSMHPELEIEKKLFGSREIEIPLKDLVKAWGPPDSSRKLWGAKAASTSFSAALAVTELFTWPSFVAIEVIFFPPCQEHLWEISGKNVEAKSCSVIFTGYNHKVVSWKWNETSVLAQ